ncbi:MULTISPECIES: hypothetical protein [Dickeya]|uniref:Uncharacterized protein n=1 Tax=Dickeya solani TaxID=1089444 RepID=A0ABU4EL69_9GAMM|nr:MULTISPECIES: hypothetical protein [Dickeya]MCA6998204.1 hypothetical protein [Dickeya solani]MDV6997165.1 hypothetical protein [Dickeya solani]MDV7004476.1 hypothetical protein [Dickeya solani]MDV7040362.1 hypothetical protein [Dickeya solani]MDV7044813.1 hypothetical protein [Dickeya solani]
MITPNWKTMIAGFVLVAMLITGWLAQYYHGVAEQQAQRAEALQSEFNAQQAVISQQSLQFQRFNQIAAQSNQQAVAITAKSEERQIVYRTIIKSDPVGRRCVPDDVAGRLLDYAHSLRSSAMHAAAGNTDTTSAGPAATGCRLTYAQAVYWIDPLLSAIERANGQLAAIREAEQSRGGSNVQR